VARLVWKRGGSAADDVVFDLGESPLVVGRDPACAIFINAPLLSREHARVEFRESRHVVIDLGSTNFTKVNGERITERALQPGDRIHFSRALCVYEA
jgi:pSer/pThr/pTyr-binding forkhead associated (FHA) protein